MGKFFNDHPELVLIGMLFFLLGVGMVCVTVAESVNPKPAATACECRIESEAK